jgi:hypothetical protein
MSGLEAAESNAQVVPGATEPRVLRQHGVRTSRLRSGKTNDLSEESVASEEQPQAVSDSRDVDDDSRAPNPSLQVAQADGHDDGDDDISGPGSAKRAKMDDSVIEMDMVTDPAARGSVAGMYTHRQPC